MAIGMGNLIPYRGFDSEQEQFGWGPGKGCFGKRGGCVGSKLNQKEFWGGEKVLQAGSLLLDTLLDKVDRNVFLEGNCMNE